ncbi:ABC transporter permease [Streptomyces sp. VRA16 Mangrove soil]|uniref:ABC transporter permease n=1 Tax=Streptomyces sp. VRA16 Mangrove soil TaxID=2817434 RepID=UPI001A9DB16F|nr:ABC transporter permease [Streptomyces sp. VRA16 Mangrove soil]MBO1332519.1 ABC transporter permease [Streptomyces sp. VRA16 Mangrove soil]
MSTATSASAVLHSEWIKIRSLRGSLGSLIAVFAATVAVTVLVFATVGQSEAESGDDLLFGAFYALNFGQIAALAFGATAVSGEFLNGALRVSLAAVPRRGLFYAAKTAVIGGCAFAVGTLTTFTAFVAGQAFMGDDALQLGDPGAVRACVGGGLYLALMALFAAGLTAGLRSAVAVLSILVPFLLIVSFVIGDLAGSAADYLPDRAGQQVLRQDAVGSLGPWTGLAVTALWAAAAVAAGWWSVRRRDA